MKILIAVAIPIFVIVFAAMFGRFNYIMPPCKLYNNFGLMCPGCGGTRSVEALLHGDFLTSFRLNPLVIFFSLLGIAFYAELIFSIFNKKIKIVPRSMVFMWVMIVLFLIFSVVRHFIPFFAL